MKKSIMDLAAEANLVEHAPEGLGGGGYIENELEIKRFANALIQECIQVCLESRDPWNLNYKPSEKMADAIRMRFGIH